MVRQVVVGAGQVGRAIAEVLGDVDLVDTEGPQRRADVLHICFPWTPSFEPDVRAHRRKSKSKLTIIHSTVPVGTSRRLQAVHSPVTGRHPRLTESIRVFPKFFGGPRAADAAALFRAVDILTIEVPEAETTEAGKLWQTLQFGWLVALQKEAYRFCEAVGAEPAVAYDLFNAVYNTGYKALGETWHLPLLEDVPGPIGGHCIVPNLDMTPGKLAEWLGELNQTWR